LTHHEKWNGGGYPEGLKGKKIPLVGRIAAIADVFDALTSKRPDKPAFEVEKSIEIIKNESGRHFDPDVVKAFLACRDDLLTVKEKYTDTSESRLIQMIDKTSGDIDALQKKSQK
jgi:putative two-component system response regulator